MYLSKAVIAWKKARNPYDVHKALWQLFPDRPDEKRNFLYRVEKQKKYDDCEILMQSAHEPVEASQHCRVIARREYILNLKAGQQLRFRLRANPTKKINDENGRRNPKGEVKKCRVQLIHEDEQKLWLERKFNEICSLASLIVNSEPPLFFRKSRRTGKVQTILFDGILRVDDPGAFISLIEKGVGPAKAFGCGLVSLARV